MVDKLVKIVLASDCPAKGKSVHGLTLGVFRHRCVYISSRCQVSSSTPIHDCPIYSHNNLEKSRDSSDHYENPLGIGACDEGASEYMLIERMKMTSEDATR